MSRKINIAASIVGEASKAVADNKFIVVFPLLPMLLVVVLFSWFMWVAAALYSVGPIPVADNNSTQISTADWGQWMMLYHVFMLLWGNNFLEGFAIVTVAGTVCGWYFTPEDKYGNRQQKDKFA